MPGSLGSLVVSLGLDAAEFISGLSRSEYLAQKSVGNITRSIDGLKKSAAGIAQALGAGLSVAGIVAWGKSVTEAAEHLSNLSVEVGSSVESLSRLQNIASISGTSVDEFQTAISRLAAGMAGASESGSKTAQALQFLGISANDPATAMQDIANKLIKFADGASKAAIARDLFGRGGVQFLSSLKDIAEASELAGTRTTKQAQEAEALAKSFRQLSVESTALKDAFLSDLVPAIEKVTSALSIAAKESGGLFSGLGILAEINPFGNISKQITATNDQLEEFKRRQAAGPKFNILGGSDERMVGQEIDRLTTKLSTLRKIQASQVGPIDPTTFDARDLRLRQKPLLGYVSGGGAGTGPIDDPAKRILDGQLKALEASIEREKDILSARAEYLRDYYQDGYLGVQTYYDNLQKARDANLQATVSDYDKELVAARAFLATRTTLTGREEANNKIADIQAKQAKAIRDAQTQEEALARERTRAAEQYAQQLDEINAKILDLAGNTADAARIRLDSQNQVFRRSLLANGDTGAAAQLDAIGRQQVAVAKLNDETRAYSLTLGQVSLIQDRIQFENQTGILTDIEAINKRSAAATAFIGVLNKQIEAAELAAKSLAPGPELDAAINKIGEMRLAVDKLAASADELAKKFNDVFSNSVENALNAAIDGTKSARDIIKGLLKDILQGIGQIANKNIAQLLFKKDGPLAGLGEGFAKLFGGGKAAEDGADLAKKTLADQSSLALQGSAASLTTSATGLQTAAIALQNAAAVLSTSNGASSLGGGFGNLFGSGSTATPFGFDSAGGFTDFFGMFGAYANGTNYAPGGWAKVGEHGPELVNLPRGAKVIPFDKAKRMGGSSTINAPINITIAGNANTRTASQVGREVYHGLERVRRRDA